MVSVVWEGEWVLSAGTASLCVDDSYVPTSVCMSGGPSIREGDHNR